MTTRERLTRMAGFVVTLLPLTPGQVTAQVVIPPDTVSTVFVSDTIPDFGAVGGVVSDALGYVYVADFANSVWRYSPGAGVTRFADGLYGASGNGVGPRGFLYQSSFNGGYISRISRAGESEIYADAGLSGPVGIAVNPPGELFVCNCSDGTIGRVGTDRQVSTFARSELLACPNGITFDDRGDLYVVNFNNTLVVRITPDGVATRFADIPGAGGNGHITFARGGFYVTKFRGNQVFRVGRDASVRTVAGTGAAGEADGAALEATFTQPNGISVDPSGKVLWVNDLVSRGSAVTGPSVTALRRIRLVALSDVLAQLPDDADPESVRGTYAAYRASRPDEDTTGDAITLAFQWMSAGRVAAGLALHEANGETFPENVAAQYNLGEAYRYTGQPDKAAAQYRRVLAMAPEHPLAQARLELVTGGS